MAHKIVKPANLLHTGDWIKFILGMTLVMAVYLTLILPNLGSYGFKPPEYDPYKIAVKEGHLEDVVYNSQLHNIHCNKTEQHCTFDITFWKPQDKEYCEYKTLLATNNWVDVKIIPTKINEFDVTRKWGWSIGLNWKIEGIKSMAQASVYARHYCTPSWPTTTPLYPNTGNSYNILYQPTIPFPFSNILKEALDARTNIYK